MWSNTQVKIAQLAAICMLLILSVQILKWISSNEFGIEASGSRERKYGGIEMSDTKKAVLIIAREIFRDEELFRQFRCPPGAQGRCGGYRGRGAVAGYKGYQGQENQD